MDYLKEEFEDWVMKTSRRNGTHLDIDSKGNYKDNRVAAKWTSWKAAVKLITNKSIQQAADYWSK